MNIPKDLDTVQNHRILLVEDNLINQKVATMLLRDLSCDVHVVDDGFQAMKLLNNQKFDMIFLDIGLKGMNGYQIAAAIRKLKNANQRKPIIAMTAHVIEEDKVRCFEAGMDDIIFKPIDIKILQKIIMKWM
jgi:two-component system, OmpR family, aerobic respiration control sensor histidine kinase ArcB